MYDFWKCKSRKNWREKNIFFFKWNDSKNIFGTEIDENEIKIARP